VSTHRAASADESAATSALQLRDRLASGALDCESLIGSCLEAIDAAEPEIQAWAWLDGDHAIEQARARDAERRRGRGIGPLHGLPVGLKDIIDTKGIPTENGCALDAGRTPREDAAIVSRLRSLGAVVLGKTVTTELAFMQPSKTRNPAAYGHTPGGSSAGSAAAVAAGMVPLAIGTQTGGSVIRPAAFCGVVGYKPSFGRIPRTGVLSQAPSLDTVGVFATCVEDAALLAEPLCFHDAGDPSSAPIPAPRLLEAALSTPPLAPTLALVETPFAGQADAEMLGALAELAAHLGEQCFAAQLPELFTEGEAARQIIQNTELARSFAHYERRGAERLSSPIRDAIAAGRSVAAIDYLAACDWPDVLNAGLEQLFDRCDAILAPAAPGPAPQGFLSTGNPVFNGLWTLCGVPTITLPLLESSNGLPMGVQLIGRRGDDARLLRTARWLESLMESEA